MDRTPTQIELDNMGVGDIMFVGSVGCHSTDNRITPTKLSIMCVPHGWNYTYTVASHHGVAVHTVFVPQ